MYEKSVAGDLADTERGEFSVNEQSRGVKSERRINRKQFFRAFKLKTLKRVRKDVLRLVLGEQVRNDGKIRIRQKPHVRLAVEFFETVYMVALTVVLSAVKGFRRFKRVNVVAPAAVARPHRRVQTSVAFDFFKRFVVDCKETERQTIFFHISEKLVDHTVGIFSDRVRERRLFAAVLPHDERAVAFAKVNAAVLPHKERPGGEIAASNALAYVRQNIFQRFYRKGFKFQHILTF